MEQVLVVGATNIDIIAKSKIHINLYDKNPGTSSINFGGVAHNILSNLVNLNTNVSFATIISNDELGKMAQDYLSMKGIELFLKKSDTPMSTFISILDNENTNYISISSMDIVDELDHNYLDTIDYSKYDLLVGDANSKEIATYLATLNKKLFIDATSVAKCNHLSNILDKITYLKCNKEEFDCLFEMKPLEEVITIYPQINIVITDGQNDILFNDGIEIKKQPVISVESINTNGAGDSFSAGLVYGISKGYDISKCISIASTIASNNVKSIKSVSDSLNENILKEII